MKAEGELIMEFQQIKLCTVDGDWLFFKCAENEKICIFSMRNLAVWKENFPESNQISQHQMCLPDSKFNVQEGTSTLQISIDHCWVHYYHKENY